MSSFRRLALILCVTLTAPWMDLLAPAPASAQQSATLSVGVVEFEDLTGHGGAFLSRTATDAIVVELGKTNRFDVIPRQQIQSQVEELDLRPPYSTTDLR